MSLGPFVRPNSGEVSDDLNEMDWLPLIHIVTELIREKDKVQRSHARVLPYDKALRGLEMSSASRRQNVTASLPVPPVVAKTTGVKDANSTSRIQSPYRLPALLLQFMTPIYRWY